MLDLGPPVLGDAYPEDQPRPYSGFLRLTAAAVLFWIAMISIFIILNR